jgi:hypothetical protein
MGVELTLGNKSRVQVSIFDAGGKKLATLMNVTLDEGEHRVAFPGAVAELPGGMYFLRLQAEGVIQTQKFILGR